MFTYFLILVSLFFFLIILVLISITLTKERNKVNNELKDNIIKHQLNSLKIIQDSIQTNISSIRSQINETLNNNTNTLEKRMDKLTDKTDKQLKGINDQLEKRLYEGFEKTTNVFTDIVKRLALIDNAQKKITELSDNIIAFQDILTDKRARGAFGEIQLSSLIRNMIPEKHFSLQHTLSNGKRADCILFLPDPTGNIVIDAKFPLENYNRLMKNRSSSEKQALEKLFKNDITRHIEDIANKYIIPNETADGAMMFIPAEAIFSEIHSHYPEIIEKSHKLKVWIVSPTTTMAILTTARAVLKDEATRKQVSIIQEHLNKLSKDFTLFQKRMTDLAKHISQAHSDVELVHKTSKRISSNFEKIEKVELDDKKEIQ